MKKSILMLCLVLVLTLVSNVYGSGIKLSEHFSQSEFACHHCGQTKVNMQLIMKLEELRKQLGQPIIITSGYRCPLHNKAIRGAKRSQHMYGNAADIKVKNVTPEMVGILARDVGFSFVRVYKSWVHVDVR